MSFVDLHVGILEEFAEQQERWGMSDRDMAILLLRRRKDRERKMAKRRAKRATLDGCRDCPACGQPIPAAEGAGRPREFCDDVCEATARRRRLGMPERRISEEQAWIYLISGQTRVDPRTVEKWLRGEPVCTAVERILARTNKPTLCSNESENVSA
jgi:hypothetical protein